MELARVGSASVFDQLLLSLSMFCTVARQAKLALRCYALRFGNRKLSGGEILTEEKEEMGISLTYFVEFLFLFRSLMVGHDILEFTHFSMCLRRTSCWLCLGVFNCMR